MTSFKQIFRVTWRPKFRTMNQLLFFDLLAVVLSMAYALWQVGFDHLELMSIVAGWGSLFGFCATILLTWQNEKIIVSDTYRLMPVGNGTLYVGNLLSSFVAMIYVGLVQAVLSVLSLLMSGQTVRTMLRTGFQHTQLTGSDWHYVQIYGPAILAYAITLVFWCWVLVTLVHLVVNVLSSLLPAVQQRLIKIVLAIILVLGIIRSIVWAGNMQERITNTLSSNAISVYLNLLTLIIPTILVGLVNAYLMKRWAEAKY